jgi:hypothetical protein
MKKNCDRKMNYDNKIKKKRKGNMKNQLNAIAK